jgi:hypothetical protein
MWNTHGPLWTAREGAEARMPPHPHATVEILRSRGIRVTVRENRTGSLRYSIDGHPECTALVMSNRLERLG